MLSNRRACARAGRGPPPPRIEEHMRTDRLASYPPEIDPVEVQRICALGRAVIEYFGIVGVLCIEMFVTRNGEVLVNELAPRPHNSGHFSLDACSISQFEALVRTVCGLPVPAPRILSPCAMVNLLGKHLQKIDLVAVQRLEGVKVHLYGKKRIEPKPGKAAFLAL